MTRGLTRTLKARCNVARCLSLFLQKEHKSQRKSHSLVHLGVHKRTRLNHYHKLWRRLMNGSRSLVDLMALSVPDERMLRTVSF
jgi:hypothetical protein